jgi:uncharacterized protein
VLVELTAEEGRVLGCLVEKELTTPQLYPLTDKALITACNQTTSRDPVVSYDMTAVRLAVRSLREKELLRTVHRTGERSDKHKHLLPAALGLTPGQVALLAVLLLRGPQTLGELRARTERMHPFPAVEEVEAELEALVARDEPLVARLERLPGRKEARYGQLLVPPPLGAPAPVPGPSYAAPGPVAPAAPAAVVREPDGGELAALRAEVAALRDRVDRLAAEVARLAGPGD